MSLPVFPRSFLVFRIHTRKFSSKIPAGQRQRGMGEPLGGLGEPNSEFGQWGHGLSFCQTPPNIDWTYRYYLGGGNSNILYVHPYLGKIPILTNIFSTGLKPPTSYIIFYISTHSLEHGRDCLRGLADERRRLVGPRSSLFWFWKFAGCWGAFSCEFWIAY